MEHDDKNRGDTSILQFNGLILGHTIQQSARSTFLLGHPYLMFQLLNKALIAKIVA